MYVRTEKFKLQYVKIDTINEPRQWLGAGLFKLQYVKIDT